MTEFFKSIGEIAAQTDKMSEAKKGWYRNLADKLKRKGYYCQKKDEPLPIYVVAKCEKVISGENNTYIVLGRDRPADRSSGYGGKGHVKCGHIDIVAGRLGYKAKEVMEKARKEKGAASSDTSDDEKLAYAEPSIDLDAARIYISQKTQVDENFKLKSTTGAVTPKHKLGASKGEEAPRSAIGIKADVLRLVARENIRLVTGTANKTSQGEKIDAPGGIDLIAGNDNSDVQPLVKGDSLCKAMKRLRDHVNKLSGLFSKYIELQSNFNQAIMQHDHHSYFMGIPTFQDFKTVLPEGIKNEIKQMVQVQTGILNHKSNMNNWSHNWFNRSGKKYICSEHNHTN